jgi:CMP-N-acetylneuraminic acid synthetase
LTSRVLGVIPARAGSKGIINKNLTDFRGQPLITYTLEAALSSQKLDEVVVSTDDSAVAELAVELGVKFIRHRPSDLCQDNSGLRPVLVDVISWAGAAVGWVPTHVVLLQPTSPLRDSQLIDDFVTHLESSSSPIAASVHEAREHPMETIFVSDGNFSGWRYCVKPPHGASRRQEYPPAFFINGAMYGFNTNYLLRTKDMLPEGGDCNFFVMPASRGLDINDDEDLLR